MGGAGAVGSGYPAAGTGRGRSAAGGGGRALTGERIWLLELEWGELAAAEGASCGLLFCLCLSLSLSLSLSGLFFSFYFLIGSLIFFIFLLIFFSKVYSL
jgi:hypothetical protein